MAQDGMGMNRERNMTKGNAPTTDLVALKSAMAILALTWVACTPSAIDPQALQGHWVHRASAMQERQVEATTHLYLQPDHAARMTLELDGMPERTMLLATWRVEGQLLVLDITERGEKISRQVRLPDDGTLIVVEADGTSSTFVPM